MMKIPTPGHLRFKYLNHCHYPALVAGDILKFKQISALIGWLGYITWHTQAQSFIGSGTMYNLNTNIDNWPGSLTWSPKLSGYSVCPRPSLPRLGVWDKLDPSLCLRVSRWHRGYWGPIRGPNFGCSRHGPKPQTIVNKSVSKRRSILGSDCMTEDWLFLTILSRTDG